MDEAGTEQVDAIFSALQGADRKGYASALETLHRRPHLVELAKPLILQAMSGAKNARLFDLAFALASLGSRDPAVLEALAQTSTPLGPLDALEPLCETAHVDRARLSADAPICGEIVLDSMGTPFLAPEEDDRGGGMGVLRLIGWSHDASGHRHGEAVRITGFYKAGVGLVVEKAWSAGANST